MTPAWVAGCRVDQESRGRGGRPASDGRGNALRQTRSGSQNKIIDFDMLRTAGIQFAKSVKTGKLYAFEEAESVTNPETGDLITTAASFNHKHLVCQGNGPQEQRPLRDGQVFLRRWRDANGLE